MLQRIQTIWLILAGACGFLTFKFSFFSGNKLDASNMKTWEHLTAATNIWMMISTILLIAVIVVAIFLYKNRKLQMRLVLLAIVISILNLFYYYLGTKKFVEGNYDLTSLLAIFLPVFLLLGLRNIYKDEKLVKSMDRLR